MLSQLGCHFSSYITFQSHLASCASSGNPLKGWRRPSSSAHRGSSVGFAPCKPSQHFGQINLNLKTCHLKYCHLNEHSPPDHNQSSCYRCWSPSGRSPGGSPRPRLGSDNQSYLGRRPCETYHQGDTDGGSKSGVGDDEVRRDEKLFTCSYCDKLHWSLTKKGAGQGKVIRLIKDQYWGQGWSPDTDPDTNRFSSNQVCKEQPDH